GNGINIVLGKRELECRAHTHRVRKGANAHLQPQQTQGLEKGVARAVIQQRTEIRYRRRKRPIFAGHVNMSPLTVSSMVRALNVFRATVPASNSSSTVPKRNKLPLPGK